jgi:hypothetical protein
MKRFSLFTHAACILVGGVISAFILRSGDNHLEKHRENPQNPTSVQRSQDYASLVKKRKQESGREFLKTMPAKENGHAREEWLKNLSQEQIPALLEALCSDMSPNDRDFAEGLLLQETLEKWMQENPEACISWVNHLPVGSMKRYFLNLMLRELMDTNPERALAISEAYQADDPYWKHSNTKDIFVHKKIEDIWKKPDFSAEELVGIHNQMERRNGCSAYRYGEFPATFDFQTFFEGLNPPPEKGRLLSPGMMPMDAMNTWARRDPQAATQWFLKTVETGENPMYYCGWEELSKGITATSGAAGYHEWAADILTRANERLFGRVVQKIQEPDMLDIAGAISNADVRDRALSAMAQSRSYNISHVVTFIGSMSTPKAKMGAISNGPATQFGEWLEKKSLKTEDWERLGLSEDQVRSAITNKTN